MENMPGTLEVLKKPFDESKRSATILLLAYVEEVLGGTSMIFCCIR
jgi:hypothetical protein